MNVGDYVRTKNKAPFEPSQIAKITNMEKDEGYKNQYFITLDHNFPTTYNFHIYSEDVIKSSPNLIDVLEVGDYVNGNVVKELNNELVIMNTGLIYDDNLYIPIKKIEIKSIVTKQQFSQMEYKIQ